jgi:dienelactone hydrolase
MATRSFIFIGIIAVLIFMISLVTVFKVPETEWLRKLFKCIGIAICTILILMVILYPCLSSVKTTGSFSYGSVILQLDDESRLETYANNGGCRKLSVIVYYPTGKYVKENSCPFVLFSHGGISIKTSNVSLFEELASHGYIVVSIDHTYQALSTMIDGKKIGIDSGYMKELNTEDSHKNIADSYKCYQKWMEIRTDDINFVIDRFISEAEKPDNGFYSLIDSQKIGLAGHSLGGSAVLGVARQRKDISAVIALEAPYMCDITGYAGDEFTWNTAPYRCAIMNIYSDTGYPLVGNDNKYVQNANYLYNKENVEYYYIQGSNHFSLTDLVRTSPMFCSLLGGGYSRPGYETLQFINEKSLDFFDKYLRLEEK